MISYTDYDKEAEDTVSQGHPVQRGPMQTDPAQKDPAQGDPDNRIVVPQIQDHTTGVFCIHSGYKQIKIKIYITE